MSYIGNPPVVQASRVITELVATAGQTDIYPLGGYTPGDYLDVEINGSALKSTDYTATDGVKITLAVAMTAGDDVRVKAYGNFLVANAVPASNSVDATKLTNGAVTQQKLGANVAGTGPAFSAYPSVGSSMTNNTWTKMLFQTEEFDTNSNYDASTSRFTPTVAGYYYVTATISGPTSGSAYFGAAVYKNGSIYMGGPVSAANGMYWNSANALVYLNGSTDYVEIYGLQTSGGTLTSYAVAGLKFQGSMVRGA